MPFRQRIWPGFVVVFVSALNEIWREKQFSILLSVVSWLGDLLKLSTAGLKENSSVPEE